MNQFKADIKSELDDLFEVDVEIQVPNNLDYGDYSTPAALTEANQKGEVPREYAKEVADKFPVSDYPYIEKVDVAGQGYINFHLDRVELGQTIISKTSGRNFDDKDQKVIVEHTSPNPNKPLHMGTMRCAILGDSMARIAEYMGYEVEVQDYINDLGRQSATAVYAYQNFLDQLDEADRDRKADYWVGVLYSKASQYLEENPDAEQDVEKIIQDIEKQDNDTFELMSEVVEKSLRGQIETAHRTNVPYDLMVFESDVVESGLFEKTMDRLRDLDKVYEITEGEDEGCTVIDMSDYTSELGEMEKPYKVLVRSDGTATYTAKDIAFTLWKFGVISDIFEYEEYGMRPDDEPFWTTGGNREKAFGDADTVINVIGRPQKFPMQVIESALRALGFEDEADEFNHLDFKFVYLTGDALPEEASEEQVAYSGRKGNWKEKHGDAVMDRAQELAAEEIETRRPEIDSETKRDISETVAVAAVRYFLLRFTRKKEINFSFEKVMDWEGDSGPYTLYSTARAYGVLENVDVEPTFEEFSEDESIELLREIDRFEEVVEEAFEVQDPSKLAHYVRTLSEKYNSFYHKCRINDAETQELKRSRAALNEGFILTMEQALELLGIDTVEEL
jgi:arginyl-tRNA synthetase